MSDVKEYCFRFTVTSELPKDLGNVPISATIDFGEKVREAGTEGVFDPNSIVVIDVASGEVVPHLRAEDFAYGDTGRVEWAIEDPVHTEYEIRFRTAEKRPPLEPQVMVPMVGVGDLLRYNAGECG